MMGERGLDFLEHSGEGAHVLVCGHFHRPGVWMRDHAVVINTGAFMRGCHPWMVEIEGDLITVREVRRFKLGEVKERFRIS